MALAQILDHAARAIARLAAQFAEAPLFKGLISAVAAEIQAVEDGLYGVLLTRDVESAEDATLDSIGVLVGAPARGGRNDTDYRNRIKTQILMNRSNGVGADVYAVSKRIIPQWDVSGHPRIHEDRVAGYTVGAPGIINDTDDARELGRILADMNPAGVRGVVLSQSISSTAAFCFEHGPGLGFGAGAFVGAYGGGKKS